MTCWVNFLRRKCKIIKTLKYNRYDIKWLCNMWFLHTGFFSVILCQGYFKNGSELRAHLVIKKKLLIFNWRTIALQYCIGFYQISTWISHSEIRHQWSGAQIGVNWRIHWQLSIAKVNKYLANLLLSFHNFSLRYW